MSEHMWAWEEMMSKYKTQESWGDGIRKWVILLIAAGVLSIAIGGLIESDRRNKAELIGQELSVEEIRRQMEDPDSYRF